MKDKVKIFKKKMKNQILLTRGDILLRHLAAIVRISLHSLEQVYRLINLFYNEKLIKKWSLDQDDQVNQGANTTNSDWSSRHPACIDSGGRHDRGKKMSVVCVYMSPVKFVAGNSRVHITRILYVVSEEEYESSLF